MSVAWPNDAYSAKMTATLESHDGGTLPGKGSDMNVQATKGLGHECPGYRSLSILFIL